MEEFLSIQPSELKFPFELKKQSSCSMQLSNKTNEYIAFKVKTTNRNTYCFRPNAGVVLPNSLCNFTVTMNAQTKAPPDMQCKDKFMVQSVIAPKGATDKDVNSDMFDKEDGKLVNELKFRVKYVLANTPSPVPSKTSSPDNAIGKSAFQVLRSLKQSMQNLVSVHCPKDLALNAKCHPRGSLEEPLLHKHISSS